MTTQKVLKHSTWNFTEEEAEELSKRAKELLFPKTLSMLSALTFQRSNLTKLYIKAKQGAQEDTWTFGKILEILNKVPVVIPCILERHQSESFTLRELHRSLILLKECSA